MGRRVDDRETRVAEAVRQLDRAQCQQLLESVSIQVYDSEGVDVLREAVIVNVLDGTLSMADVRAAMAGGAV